MPSITTWTRLEPRSRQEDMSAFLRAQVADPLWNLAVQWRIGEFTGEDAAFPIAAAYQVTVRPLVPVAAAADPQLPADALLGAESPAQPGTASAADNGAELLQQLADHAVSTAGITAIVAAHPFTTAATDVADPQGASYLRLLSGRIPDGDSWEPLLRAATAPGGTLPAGAGVPASDTTAVLAAATVWLAALDARQPPGGQSWQAETLEYQFSVPVASAVGTFATAQAPTWDGDELDWYHFDLVAGSEAPPTYPVLPGVDPTTGTISGVGVPHPLSYPGAPDPRYWAMEDANVSFPDVQVGVADLARMLVVEFATVTAPNWYLQPLPLPTGGVHTVSLTVTNTFGETTAVPMLATSLAGPGQTPSSVPDWVMFRPTTSTDDGGTAPLDGLLLPSLSIDDLRSAPVESVALVRDDSADRAWALETTVLGGDSRPVDRYSASTAASTQPPPAPPEDGSTVRYQLASAVPPWAYVLLAADTPAPLLELTLPDPAQPPLGALLRDVRGHQIRQEQVPPWQATLIRQRRMSRGPDGQVLAWTTRQYRAGGSARSIALGFDQLTSAIQREPGIMG